MNLNLFIAKKIKGKGLSSASNTIALVSVAISIAVIIIAVAISDGFRKEIGKRAVGFSGEILMTAPGMEYTNDIYPMDAGFSYMQDIRDLPEVESVSETAYKPGMVKSGSEVHGMVFKGVDSTYSLDFFADYLTEGRLPSFSGRRISDEVLVSVRFATMMGYGVGDRMDVYFVGEQVRVRRLTITGLYDIRLEDMDEMLAVADIRQIRRLNGWTGHESSCVEIALKGDGTASDPELRSRVASRIGDIIMEKDCPEDDSVVVTTIDSVYPSLFDWLALLDLNVLVVMVLMIAVAGFNMVSGLLIILFEKISMIGLLKSLGMRTSSICRIFLYRGGAIVLKGVLWGNAVALLLLAVQKLFRPLSLNPVNYFVDFVPVDLDPVKIIVTDVASFIVLMLIMTIPSLFISKVSPDRTIKVS